MTSHLCHFTVTYLNVCVRGGPQVCLQYLVLANMLSNNRTNPLDATNTKMLKNDPKVRPFSDLRLAYERNEVPEFGKGKIKSNQIKSQKNISGQTKRTTETKNGMGWVCP